MSDHKTNLDQKNTVAVNVQPLTPFVTKGKLTPEEKAVRDRLFGRK